jgi:PAS domain S-box-containing protein
MLATGEFAQRLVSANVKNPRLAQLLAILSLAAALTGVIAATLTWVYGYPDLAINIYIAAVTFPLTIVILNYTGKSAVAGHYLAANIFLQTLLFSAEPAVGCVVLVCLAAGAALLGNIGGSFWLLVIVLRCVQLAFVAPSQAMSATAAVSAVAAVIVFLIVRLSESSRSRLFKRANAKSTINAKQVEVLEALVADYFDAVLQVSGNDIFHVSRSVETLLGYPPDKFIDRPLNNYLHPEESDLTEELTPGKPAFRREIRMRHANGRWVWVEMYASPGVFGGNPNRMSLVLRDYEKERKVIDQLTQAQRLEGMGSMAAAVAHDFNNMLTVIMGIADELPPGDARSEIRRVTGNAAALTNKLLTFGHGQITTSEIQDLSHLMHEHSLLLQHTLDSRYIVLESYTEDPLLVRIEESQFEQVLVNLVNNAREAMPRGGELEVSLQYVEIEADQGKEKEGHWALLEVTDSGQGIDTETQAKVFDPFFTTKSTQSNSGLGLSSCYGIVSQYGGFIEIDSTIGVGTTIRVYLPIAETRDYEPTLDVIDNEVSIMVVDDDPGVVRVVKNALVRTGYSVRGFTDVGAAKDYFAPHKVSMVISDVVMPGESGAHFVSEIRKRAPELPVLFISGFSNEELNTWEQNDITNYLAKPFRGEEVVSRVESLLNARMSRQKVLG